MERTRTRTVDDPLQNALNDVRLALAPLPDGYSIEVRDKGLIVGCKFPEPDGIGFAITERDIALDQHVAVAVKSFPGLLYAVQEAGGPLADGQKASN